MRDLYTALSKIFDSLDWEKLWPGFQRTRFALYDDKRVFFEKNTIPYDTRFLGNTSIEYEGEYIAIWKVNKPKAEDPEILAANLAHEMFHAFQRKMGESRYPNDLLMLDYPETVENYQIKYLENTILAMAYLEEDTIAKKALFRQFISLRKSREHLLGDIIRCEYLIETAEGMADYAGTMALAQISPDKFLKRMQDYVRVLQSPDALFDNARTTHYIAGAVICIVAGQAQINLFHDIRENQKTVFELLSGGIPVKAVEKPGPDEIIAEKLLEYVDGKKKRVDAFLETHDKRTAGNFIICGYDPMNMIKSENRILCGHFVMLMNPVTQERIQIINPVLLEMKPGTINEVVAYIT